MESVYANIEVLLMCMLMVAFLFHFNRRYWKPKLINPLSLIYLDVIFGCLFEMGAFWVNGKPELIWANYLMNICYLGTIGMMGLCFMFYCNERFPKPLFRNRAQLMLAIVPITVEYLFLISAPWTGIIFYVTDQGVYIRSSTFFIQLIPYGYLLYCTAWGIVWWFRAETIREKNLYMTIALFALPAFLLGGIQLLLPANLLDILEFSIVLSLLVNFAVTQSNRITTDALTGLATRESVDSYLTEKIRDHRRYEKTDLIVMMCDLDGFKSINDTCGHLEGDRALILAAGTMEKICNPFQAFTGRFGGDEFVIVLETEDADAPERLISELNARLKEVSLSEKFNLAMSVGCAKFRSSDTVADLLKAADRELYAIKAERKARKI